MEVFDNEIERILSEVYNNPLESASSVVKRSIIKCEYRYIEFLSNNGFIKRMPNVDGNGKFGIQLENKGYEVFEKYDGWIDYKKKVISKAERIENAKGLAARFWWLPIVISLIALGVSIYSMIKK